MEAPSLRTHPTDLTRGTTNNKRIRWYRFGNHSTGTDKGIGADFVAANDGGIGTDGGTATYIGGAIFRLTIDGAAWIDYVRKHHRRTKKNIVFANNTFVKRYVILHLYIAAQHDASTHKYTLSQVAICADTAARHQVAKMPDVNTGADLGAFVNNCSRMQKIICSGCQQGKAIRSMNNYGAGDTRQRQFSIRLLPKSPAHSQAAGGLY
jgi:hypothetical protein